jgi:hypothetical protein
MPRPGKTARAWLGLVWGRDYDMLDKTRWISKYMST